MKTALRFSCFVLLLLSCNESKLIRDEAVALRSIEGWEGCIDDCPLTLGCSDRNIWFVYELPNPDPPYSGYAVSYISFTFTSVGVPNGYGGHYGTYSQTFVPGGNTPGVGTAPPYEAIFLDEEKFRNIHCVLEEGNPGYYFVQIEAWFDNLSTPGTELIAVPYSIEVGISVSLINQSNQCYFNCEDIRNGRRQFTAEGWQNLSGPVDQWNITEEQYTNGFAQFDWYLVFCCSVEEEPYCCYAEWATENSN